jgi:hypothetical protein
VPINAKNTLNSKYYRKIGRFFNRKNAIISKTSSKLPVWEENHTIFVALKQDYSVLLVAQKIILRI